MVISVTYDKRLIRNDNDFFYIQYDWYGQSFILVRAAHRCQGLLLRQGEQAHRSFRNSTQRHHGSGQFNN